MKSLPCINSARLRAATHASRARRIRLNRQGWPENRPKAGQTTAALQAEQHASRWPRPCPPLHRSQRSPRCGRPGRQGQRRPPTVAGPVAESGAGWSQGLGESNHRALRLRNSSRNPPGPPGPCPSPQHVVGGAVEPGTQFAQVDVPPTQRPASQPNGIEPIVYPVSITQGAEARFYGRVRVAGRGGAGAAWSQSGPLEGHSWRWAAKKRAQSGNCRNRMSTTASEASITDETATPPVLSSRSALLDQGHPGRSKRTMPLLGPKSSRPGPGSPGQAAGATQPRRFGLAGQYQGLDKRSP